MISSFEKDSYSSSLAYPHDKNQKTGNEKKEKTRELFLLSNSLSSFIPIDAQPAQNNSVPYTYTLIDTKHIQGDLQLYNPTSPQPILTYAHQQLIEKVQQGVACVLYDPKQEKVIQELVKKHALQETRQAIRAILQEKLEQINEQFPQQLDECLRKVTQQTWDTLATKREEMESICGGYLETLALLERYFQGFTLQTGIILPPIYEEQTLLMIELKHALLKSGSRLLLQTVEQGSDKTLDSLEDFLKKTKDKIVQNAEKVMTSFEKQWEQEMVQEGQVAAHQEQVIDLVEKATDFYTSSLEHYFSLTASAINLFIENIDGQLDFIKTHLESLVQHLAQKEKFIVDFLEHEIELILKTGEMQQQPKISKAFGIKTDVFFDDTALRRYGPISKITLFTVHQLPLRLRCSYPLSGGRIYGIQVTYGKHEQVLRGDYQKWNTPKNSKDTSKIDICLEANERINRIEVITSRALKTISDFVFYTNKNRQLGPYLGEYRGQYTYHVETVTFAPDYSLAAIQGWIINYQDDETSYAHLSGISFAFLKDFSSLRDKNIAVRLQKAVQLFDQMPVENNCLQIIDQLRNSEKEFKKGRSFLTEAKNPPLTENPLSLAQEPFKILLLSSPQEKEIQLLETYLTQHSEREIKIQLYQLVDKNLESLKELILRALTWNLQELCKKKLRYIASSMRL